jgi:3-hydroxyisobutyrate dehydrogenase-like beta-hydroxyacid dehydrogenase
MIGVIGVGDMGLLMCGRILARGFDVIAYDLDRGRLSAQLRHLPGAERRPRPAADRPGDQLVETMTAAVVAALLHEQECTYLGRRIRPLASSEGGR